MKQKIRLTESDLHRIIKESVNNVLKEEIDTTNALSQIVNYPKIIQLFKDLRDGNVSVNDAIKTFETELSWLAWELEGDGNGITPRKSKDSKEMYNYSRNRLPQAQGVKNPYGLPDENLNKFDTWK